MLGIRPAGSDPLARPHDYPDRRQSRDRPRHAAHRRGLSFRVAAGEGLLLTGPNGAGKTTLLRTIAGFLRPLDGGVRLDGLGDERDLGEACHYVGHANGLRGSLTARENLEFWQQFFAGID